MIKRVERERIEWVVEQDARAIEPENGHWVFTAAMQGIMVKRIRRELAKERVRVRRIVKDKYKAARADENVYDDYWKGFRAACDSILAAIRGRKGTR